MVYILLSEGFEEIEALAVADILRRAEIETCLVSVSGDDFVEGAHGIAVKADISIKNIDEEYDMIVLPGGAPGYVNLEKSDDVKKAVENAYNKNKYIAAICASPSILGKWGLLKGRKTTCFPSFEEYLYGAEVVFDNVVCDEKIITSRGAGTAHDFAFKIVEILKDKSLAENLRKSMIY